MYTTCTFCYGQLGTNDVLETFQVSRRVAFDPAKACLWAVCPSCARWNLAPVEERWETVDECERRFRATSLRYSSGNVGLAWLKGDLDLIRIAEDVEDAEMQVQNFLLQNYGPTLLRDAW